MLCLSLFRSLTSNLTRDVQSDTFVFRPELFFFSFCPSICWAGSPGAGSPGAAQQGTLEILCRTFLESRDSADESLRKMVEREAMVPFDIILEVITSVFMLEPFRPRQVNPIALVGLPEAFHLSPCG